jgi:predicted Zn-dependent protease
MNDYISSIESAELSPEDEYRIGRSVAANLIKRYGVYNDPQLTSYLNLICGVLTLNSPTPVIYGGYHVQVLNTNEINAFATPGGHIFLTRGMINCATSEDALAAVIAHEIAHIQLHHGAGKIKDVKFTEDMTRIANRSAAIASKSVTNLQVRLNIFKTSTTEMVNRLTTAGFDVQQEKDADKLAVLLLHRSGYETSGLVDVLRSLETGLRDHPSAFNRTHPAPGARIRDAEQYLRAAQSLPKPVLAPPPPEYSAPVAQATVQAAPLPVPAPVQAAPLPAPVPVKPAAQSSAPLPAPGSTAQAALAPASSAQIRSGSGPQASIRQTQTIAAGPPPSNTAGKTVGSAKIRRTVRFEANIRKLRLQQG